MRAMILAAGRGLRMGALTATVPKPLLRVADHYLIEYAIFSLANAGVHDVIINISYQAEQIKKTVGDGARYGIRIHYSEEAEALETGGGIFKALPLLGTEPFIVLSSDIISHYDLNKLPKNPVGLAHLVLVDNPKFHAKGDFSLQGQQVCLMDSHSATFTYANIGIYRPELFAGCSPGHFPLAGLLKKAITNQQVSGEYFQGPWCNLGTPEQLNEALDILR